MQKLKSKDGPIIEIPVDLPVYREYAQSHREWLANSAMQNLVSLTGDFGYSDSDGILAGTHNGAHFYTIGQRKGLNIGGKTEPMFVIGTDTQTNRIYVGMGHGHPGLNRWGLFVPVADLHWLRRDQAMSSGESRKYQVRVRYRQPLQDAMLYMKDEGLHIIFDRKQRGITSGQFAAWYDGDELIGSGVIS
jgi:tRNA-specific 2-thiouridylase